MFEKVIVEQNPHWKGGGYEQLLEREILTDLIDYLKVPHVISVTGMRRAGKSTLLKLAINYLMQKKGVPPKTFCLSTSSTPTLVSMRPMCSI